MILHWSVIATVPLAVRTERSLLIVLAAEVHVRPTREVVHHRLLGSCARPVAALSHLSGVHIVTLDNVGFAACVLLLSDLGPAWLGAT